MFMFRVNLGMWPLKLIILEKPFKPCSEGSNTIYAVSKEIDGKMFMFRVNLGMWPLKLIILEKRALFWGFQYTFIGKCSPLKFPRREMGKHFMFRVNLGMWPFKLIVLEKRALFWGFKSHLCSFQGDRWENIYV